MPENKEEKIGKDIHHQIKKEILNESEISIILDRYDDIFSSFDPRPYAVRELSDDFIQEAKRAIRQKREGKVELKFLVPANNRKLSDENLIKKRLREHFKEKLIQSRKEVNSIKRRGANMIVIGTIFGVIATFVSLWETEKIFLQHALLVLLEPASWFNIWSGFDQFVFTANERKIELEFNERMNDIEIIFTGY